MRVKVLPLDEDATAAWQAEFKGERIPDSAEIKKLIADAPQPVTPSSSVEYTSTHVIAYFSAVGKSTTKALAAWAKVWYPDGRMEIVAVPNG